MIRKVSLLCSLFAFCLSCYAQDLNASVQVLSPQIQNTNKRILNSLESTVKDFLNNRKWTTYPVAPQERIDCYLILTIKEWDGSSTFKAEAQIRSSRPVYNSDYTSPVLALSDPIFNFSYTEGEPLDFSDQRYTSNLSSLLAFYAYLIVGADADTFLPMGGNEAFNKAAQVVVNAQSSSYAGWNAAEGSTGRYWLSNNLMDRNYQPLRNFNFQFHSRVLDELAGNRNAVRNLAGLIPSLASIDRFAMGAVYHQLFFTAKHGELADLVALMQGNDRLRSITALRELDPAHAEYYEALRKLN